MINFVRDLLSSFYSRPFYPVLIRKRRGIGIGFFLFIITFDLLLIGVRTYGPGTFEADHLAKVVERFPDMVLSQGQLTIDKAKIFREPIFPDAPPDVLDPLGTPAQMVVNPTWDMSNERATVNYLLAEHIDILLASHGVAVLGSPQHPLSTYSFGPLGDRALTHQTWMRLAWWLRTFLWPVTVLLSVPWVLLFVGGSILGFSLVARALSWMQAPAVSSSATLRWAAATGVPATVLAEVIWPIMIVKFAIWLAYILFVFFCLRTTPDEAVEAAPETVAPPSSPLD